jgi:hypothetical protein
MAEGKGRGQKVEGRGQRAEGKGGGMKAEGRGQGDRRKGRLLYGYYTATIKLAINDLT